MREERAAANLRAAAAEFSRGLNEPVHDAKDTAGVMRNSRLLKAAVSYAGKLAAMTKKRGYSREFTPQTDRRVRFEIDRIPPTLWLKVQAKAKREGVSLRALILTLLTIWTKDE